VLDQCDGWANLVPEIVYRAGIDLWVVPLDDVKQLG
jgi:hypothetical protein